MALLTSLYSGQQDVGRLLAFRRASVALNALLEFVRIVIENGVLEPSLRNVRLRNGRQRRVRREA